MFLIVIISHFQYLKIQNYINKNTKLIVKNTIYKC